MNARQRKWFARTGLLCFLEGKSVNRRALFRWISLALTGCFALFLAVPGVGMLVEPLRRQAKKGKRRRLLKLSDLEIGVPRKFVLRDRRTDAWTRYPEGPIGGVWLVRRDERQVDVFSVTCPHLGCQVDHVASEKKFFCPCHEASFTDEGEIISGPQRRGLDRLDTVIENVKGEEWVSVIFQRFESGSEEKIPLG